jgi:hypothetical protein
MWLALWLRARHRMPREARRFVAGLWLIVASFYLVNNFSVMKSSFGLGLWWITLGLVGTTVGRYVTAAPSRLAQRAGAADG